MFNRQDLRNLFWKTVISVVFLSVISSFSYTEANSQQANDVLFTDAPGYAVSHTQIERERQDTTIRRSRYVHGNFDLLKESKAPLDTMPLPDVSSPRLSRPAPAQKSALTLNLFDDVSVSAVNDRLEFRSANKYTWHGHIEGIEHSQVILVNEDGDMAGEIFVRPGEHYQIRPVGDGIHAIYDVDTSAFPPEAEPIPVYTTQDTSALSPPMAACCDNGTTIDVMVVYTQDAAAASGNIDAEIQLAIDYTNAAYSNSLINQRLRLVHTAQVNYTEGAGSDLSKLQNPSDGYLDEVHAWRDLYHADIVSLWVNNLPSICGIAYMMNTVNTSFASWAFSVIRRSCGGSAFAHELGHNMGAHHDRANAGNGKGAYEYSYGYQYMSQDYSKRFMTIMAYQCDACYPIMYFSNPLVNYNGIPTGIPEGQYNSADNAKTLNNTAYAVSNFRQSDGGITPDTLITTGSMISARWGHAATLLPDGKVLMTGGRDKSNNFLSSAELYDPSTMTFSPTGSMSTIRFWHTATLMSNGKVLITSGAPTHVAELYDPTTGTFSSTGSANIGGTSTLLPNGKVLIANVGTTEAMLYDSSTGIFSATGSMITIRNKKTATLLPNGKVLIAGGHGNSGGYLSSTEVYDPNSGTFSVTGSMMAARAYHTATLLPNGKVLIAGGKNSSSDPLSSSELYDPTTGTFSPTGSMSYARRQHSATLLLNGQVLIAEGYNGSTYPLTELYDPDSQTFKVIGSWPSSSEISGRLNHSATLLTDGKVLIAGGFNQLSGVSSAELFNPRSSTDTIGPVITSFAINDNSLSTGNVDITLNISATDNIGVVAYYASESPNVPTAQAEYWMPIISVTDYSGNVSFRLSNGAGTKTVYVWVKDGAGNISSSVSDTIEYIPDLTVPSTTVSPPGGIYASTQIVTLVCTDDNSGCDKTYYTTDGSMPTTASTIYGGPIAISTNRTLKYFSRDNAGNSESVKTQTYVIDSIAPTTTVSPVGGTYTLARSVILTCSDSNSGCAGTYYTTDGTEPTLSSTLYTGPITISANTILKYFSKDNAGNIETVKTQTYVIDSIAPTTTATPASGTYTSAQTVTLTCTDSNTGCANTYYTTNGTTPTTSSPVYTAPITISANTTMKFFSRDNAGNGEAVKTQTYVIDTSPPLLIQSISEGFESGDFSQLPWRTGGNGVWNISGSVRYRGNYSAAAPASIGDSQSSYVEVTLTVGSGNVSFYRSVSSEANYDNLVFKIDGIQKGAWSGSLVWGQFSYPVSAGQHTFRWEYTKDSSMSSGSDMAWVDDIVFPGSSNSFLINSGTSSTNNPAVTVTFTECYDVSGCGQVAVSNSSNPSNFQTVTWAGSAGSIQTTTINHVLSSGDGVKTIYAIVKDTLGNATTEMSSSIILDTTPPITDAGLIGGTYTSAQLVSLTCNDGSGIGCAASYYTTDGATPTTASRLYTGAIPVNSNITLKFFSKDNIGNMEEVKTQAYIIDSIAPVTTTSPAGGTYTSVQSITLSCGDSNSGCAATYYTTDSSTPTTTSPVYTGPITINANTTLKFFSKDNAGNIEAVRTQNYVIDSVAPITTASPPEGSYTATQSLTLTCSDGNSGCAATYYTTDGSTPTTSSSPYISPITISANTTLKFFSKDNAGNSEAVQTHTYTVLRTLTVLRAGNGMGTVTSSPYGIDCGIDCSGSFDAPAVTLTATAEAGSGFTGWNGACTGVGTCTVTMSMDQSATATFIKLPTVSTGPVTNVTTTSSTLTGVANTNGGNGSAWFEYGATIAYGNTTLMQAVSGSTDAKISQEIKGFSPATLYHYRFCAEVSGQTVCGSDTSFITRSMVLGDSGNISLVVPATANRIDGYDLIMMGRAFGSNPSMSNWNPLADLNGDGIVDGADLTILAINFGKVQ